ncbi:MAG: metalloregulator ArsR/SmtB family transcription factor [Planctomycetes bacterium]|nr:metalloregulator ArsR/SmtB family transcription factor [Planctomycetota bacterium]
MRKHHRPSPAPRTTPLKGKLASRRKLDATVVRRLAEMFGLLSSPTRLRILHALAREGELHVQGVADALRMRVTAVSNQLRLMAIVGILSARSEGLRVVYSVSQTWVPALFEAGLAHASGKSRA